MSKQKYDLSNVGGQPKDWAQRSRESDINGDWWEDVKMTSGCAVLVIGLVVSAGALLYGLLKFSSKF